MKDGGPAFPVYPKHSGVSSIEPKDALGMSLRDYFAAKAMQAGIAYWAGYGSMYDEGGCTHSKLAQQAYQIADAMLAARDPKP